MKSFKSLDPVIVIGSGLAGLSTALTIAENQPVILITKKKLTNSNTQLSQGGIAAVWSNDDSCESHIRDTLVAGSGLCDEKAVSILSKDSKSAIERLVKNGVVFDKDNNGNFLLGLEGAHSKPRILHAGGDATGAEIQRAFTTNVLIDNNINIFENTQVIKLITDNLQIEGVVICNHLGKTETINSRQVVLATGGAGQLFQYTSNPDTATGEGCILAYQAGAELSDLEFFQFHPTTLCLPGAPNFLISEAVRGEGAILRNVKKEAFMETVHPLKDLAPRDIVTRAIASEMQETDAAHVFLDVTMLDADKTRKRFPNIFRTCLDYGIDITKQYTPVTPAAHCMMGGITTDLKGRTTVPGLYACGEAARTGVHGSNRLASNSLLECAIFSLKSGETVIQDQTSVPDKWLNKNPMPHLNLSGSKHKPSNLKDISLNKLQSLMWENAGIIRNEESLTKLITEIGEVPPYNTAKCNLKSFELHALKLLGKLLAKSALLRKESRGSHYRSDYPHSNPKATNIIKTTIE